MLRLALLALLLPAALAAQTAALPGDIDRLTGPAWTGTLTYLDYTTAKPTTIRSGQLVVRLADRPDGSHAWDIRTSYADEPHADRGETVLLSADGTTFRDERVIQRTMEVDGSVVLVTETRGTDNDRPATFQFEYRLGQRRASIRKLVQYTEGEAFFERNVYNYARSEN
jgi:hypothetical protein